MGGTANLAVPGGNLPPDAFIKKFPCYVRRVKTAIHWFRRDLRVSDNTALSEAVACAERVVPVFILEDALRTGPDVGAARLAFLLQSLESLRKNLAELGYPLIIRNGRSEVEIPKLCQELNAQAVFANKRYEPYAQTRDNRVFNALNAVGVGFELFKDAVIREEAELLTQAGKPFTVFTPYSKLWKTKPVLPPRAKLAPNPAAKSGKSAALAPVPLDPGTFGHPLTQTFFPAGEKAGLDALRKFMRGPVYDYATNRNLVVVEGSSRLSPHLRCGTVGIRTVMAELNRAREKAVTPAQKQSCETFLNELIWREFYLQILHHFPHVMKGAFRPEYDLLKWSDNPAHFEAWCQGRTGYPIVDAAMRCLNQTGWMHNRLRMIVAMFLTKDLLINWQWGERYFMRQLVDGDLAANNGGWQWSAGSGTDAAPYFRIFNPVTQSEKCDPKGAFVRQWIPELASIPDDLIHQPWKEPLRLSGSKYPERIVIHEEQRPKCLAMFAALKNRG
ncbi:MAG: deoxyribodipyrimidine photo-lyase [Akkermansiaceae bacterium]|nr:deoxyribodipyrimidine photo-lyase [Verrucomicrobiales bacterium]